MVWTIVGSIAALCTTVGFIPQIIRGIRTRKLNDVSPLMLSLLLLGCSLWLAYGLHRKDVFLILANGFTVTFIFTIFFMRIVFRKNTQKTW